MDLCARFSVKASPYCIWASTNMFDEPLDFCEGFKPTLTCYTAPGDDTVDECRPMSCNA